MLHLQPIVLTVQPKAALEISKIEWSVAPPGDTHSVPRVPFDCNHDECSVRIPEGADSEVRRQAR